MAEPQWYKQVAGDDLEQGDIVTNCPVPLISPNSALAEIRDAIASNKPVPSRVDWKLFDLIVLSQTCDMVQSEGRKPKIEYVLLSPVWGVSSQKNGLLASAAGKELVRRGGLQSNHMLGPCNLPGQDRETSVVEFQKIYTLPLAFFRTVASSGGDRLRLLSPYKESLSQAFARFVMRVGLPTDIPPFLPNLTSAVLAQALMEVDPP